MSSLTSLWEDRELYFAGSSSPPLSIIVEEEMHHIAPSLALLVQLLLLSPAIVVAFCSLCCKLESSSASPNNLISAVVASPECKRFIYLLFFFELWRWNILWVNVYLYLKFENSSIQYYCDHAFCHWNCKCWNNSGK